MSQDAQQLVELIQKIVDEALATRDRTQPCIIHAVNTDGTLDISLPPDDINVLHGIINQSGYKFKAGDSAVLYLIRGKTSNAFVISKNNATEADRIF